MKKENKIKYWFVRWLIITLVAAGLLLASASADTYQIEEGGDWIHIGGINYLDGVSYQTRSGLTELKEKLEDYGYVSIRTLDASDVNRVLSVNNVLWFIDYTWYPYDSSNSVVYVNPIVFNKALAESKKSPDLSDLIYYELIGSTVVVTYSGVEAIEKYGTVYNKYNEALIDIWQDALQYGSDIMPEYVILKSPIDCDIILTIQSTLRVYHFQLKANEELRLLLFDQCYVTYINGVDISSDRIQTPSYTYDDDVDEAKLTLDLTKTIETHKIARRDLEGQTASFGMGLVEWKEYWTKAERGSKYVKPTWGEEEVIVNTEPYIPDTAALDPSKEQENTDEKYDITMYFPSEQTEVAEKVMDKLDKQIKKETAKILLWVIFGIPFVLAVIIVIIRAIKARIKMNG